MILHLAYTALLVLMAVAGCVSLTWAMMDNDYWIAATSAVLLLVCHVGLSVEWALFQLQRRRR